MTRPQRLFLVLVFVAALLAWIRAEEEKGGKKQRRQKGRNGMGGGPSAEDSAVRQVLKDMAKVSSPLRLPPSSASVINSGSNNSNSNSHSRAVAVSVDFGLATISDVNANGGYVDLDGTLTTMWVDPRLKFDLSKVSREIRTVRVDSSSIWTPDLEVYNAVAPGLQVVTKHPLAVVSSSGDVFLNTQVHIRSSCDVLGQQAVSEIINCTVKMGSGTYNGLELQLNMNQANLNILNSFTETGQWSVRGARAWAGYQAFECCPETYPYVMFSYLLRKRELSSQQLSN